MPDSSAFPSDVTVVILSYNSLEKHLRSCVSWTVEAGCPQDRLIVVDNASTDGTCDWMRDTWPDVHCAVVATNIGPNRGRNRGIAEAATPYVLVIDVDNQLLAGTVAEMRRVFDTDPRVAIVAPVVAYPDRPDTINYALTWFHYLGEASATHNDRKIATLGSDPIECGTVTGCAMMLRKSTAEEIGAFDENLYFGKEDGEFCFRATMAGHKVMVTPRTKVLHHHEVRGDAYYNHQIAGRWYFILKNFQGSTILVCLPALILHEVLLILFLIKGGRFGAWLKATGHFRKFAGKIPAMRRRAKALRRCADVELLRGDAMVLPPMKPGLVRTMLSGYAALIAVYWRVAQLILKPAQRLTARGKGS